ncbi:MAG TPA: hypothetical protein DCP97_02775 [Ruminococcaceae bacterium]|nr:hypothetical protein [Oscillospiraceae bacterium]
MNGVSLLPLEYKLVQSKKEKQKQYIEIAAISSVVIFVMLILTSIAIIISSNIINSLEKTNQSIIKQSAALGDYKPILNEINTSVSQVSSAIGSYPDMLWLMSELARAVPDGVSVADIAIKYDGNAGTCTVYGKAASHSAVSAFIDNMANIEGLSEPKCSYSKPSLLLSEFEIIANIKNNIPQQLSPE